MKTSLGYCFVLVLSLLVLVSCTQPTATQTPAPAVTAAATPSRPSTPAPEVPKASPKPTTPTPAGSPYYQGKTIEIIVDMAPGGGTDTTARVISAFLPRYLPGNPKIIVRNQPGAGGVVAANSFFEKARPDGLSLLHGSLTPISSQQRKRDIVKYDLLKMRLIGNIAEAGSVLCIRKAAMNRLNDPNAEPLVVATKEGTETWNLMALYGKEFLGWNVRWVPGFGGTGEIVMAFRRGEADMFGDGQNIKMLAEEGLAEPLAQLGSYKGGKYVARPDFPATLPIFPELMGSKKPAGLPWEAYTATVAPITVFKFTAAAPGTPDNVVQILRDAYAKLDQDPQASEMLKKSFSEVYTISSGKDTEMLMKQSLEVTPEAVVYVDNLLRKFGIQK